MTLGIPIELGAVLHHEAVGVGLSAFGNLNKTHSFFGLSLTRHLGKMR